MSDTRRDLNRRVKHTLWHNGTSRLLMEEMWRSLMVETVLEASECGITFHKA